VAPHGTLSRTATAVLTAGAALVPAACSREASATYSGAPANVVLIVVDTLRADALGAYGAARPTSPNLDALASRSLVFERSFATAPWTLPSVASLFTGTYPSLHGQTESEGPLARLSDDLVTMAEVMRASGYDTAAFSAHPWVSPEFGLGQGFANEDFHVFAVPGGDARVTAAATGWIRARRENANGRRFFAYLHYLRPHTPYNPTREAQRAVLGSVPAAPPFSAALARVHQDQAFTVLDEAARRGEVTAADVEYLRGMYEAEVRMADYEVGKVLAALSEQGFGEDTLVVVTSDHGEAFLEHGLMVHGTALHQEMLRVPLIVHLPGQATASRVQHAVQQVDVLPTVLEAIGLPVPAQVQGRVRLPGRDRGATTVFAESPFGIRETRVMERGFALLGDPRAPAGQRLYHLPDDPMELRDAAGRFPREARRLRRELDGFLRHNEKRRQALARTPPAISAETRERVRSLGYAE
jgi:arylsulfatase A-like enzyme